MEIEWRSNNESPYLFRQVAQWPGLRIHRARVRPGRMLEHTNTFHEVNVALNGTLVTEKHSGAGRRIITHGGRGNLCITPAGQAISASWEKTLDNLGFFFDPDLVAKTAVENHFMPNFEFIEIQRKDDDLIRNIGLTLLSEADSETPAGRLFSDSLIQTLTLHLLCNYSTAKPVPQMNGGLSGYKLRRVQEFINENLENDLSLNELAAVADLSQFHFARAFRKTVGQTPQQYLMQRRIEKAKDLLAKGDLPIVEVSLMTGFKNQSHFTTLFRKFTNLTPKSWRDARLV